MEISYSCNVIKHVSQMLRTNPGLSTVTVLGSLSTFSQSLFEHSLGVIFCIWETIISMPSLDILSSFSTPTPEIEPLSEDPLFSYLFLSTHLIPYVMHPHII